MSKLLEVREFDTIVCNKDFADDERYKYLPESAFTDFVDFIHSNEGTDEIADALEFLKVGYKRNVGTTITVNNYVGLIQMKNGYQVQILPKIDFNYTDEENVQTKKVFMNMLKSMKDFPGKVFNEANLKMDRMNIYEIFINMFIQEVRQLIKKGLKSGYISKEENTNFYKGKLLFNEHIKQNFAHKEKFYVSYDEYQLNRAENRLIKATLIKLHSITTSAENNKEIKQVLSAFEHVQASTNYEKDFAKVVIDRNTKQYETLIQWSKVFLMNKSFTSFSGNTTARALMFPMEKVFESYVAKWMKTVFREKGWDVSAQDRGYYLFDSPRRFALRPDIVVDCGGGRRIIMDTKWKKLVDNPGRNYGISQADMYQMYAYAKKYETSKVWLIYPQTAELKSEKKISFNSDDNVTVNVFFVDLNDIRSTLEVLEKRILQKI